MDEMDGKNRICQIIEEKQTIFTAVSDQIWNYAETRFELPQSSDALCAVLEREGFQVERGCGGMSSAFVAAYGCDKPVIGILAEYDALPNLSQEAGVPRKQPITEGGSGHGCGHNALGAGALAGAVGIKAYMREAGLSGTIKLFGCPAEESGSGKAFMARAGAFDGLDAILTWHPMTETMIWGTSSLANYQVYFKFKGVSAHAAASPQYGRSALDAAELMSVGVNYLREHIEQEARIHYAYIDAGGISPNVVQPTAKVLYFIRAPRSAQVKEIFKRVVDVAEGAAKMTGTTMEVEWDSACAEYIINESLAKAMYANMRRLGNMEFSEDEYDLAARYTDSLDEMSRAAFRDKVRRMFPEKTDEDVQTLADKSLLNELAPYSLTDAAMPGSTDVGDASWHAPTAQLFTTCYPAGTSAHSWQYVACGKSGFTHKGLLYAGKVIAMTALDLLDTPKLLDEAKKEYDKRTASEKYSCPIPADVHPR